MTGTGTIYIGRHMHSTLPTPKPPADQRNTTEESGQRLFGCLTQWCGNQAGQDTGETTALTSTERQSLSTQLLEFLHRNNIYIEDISVACKLAANGIFGSVSFMYAEANDTPDAAKPIFWITVGGAILFASGVTGVKLTKPDGTGRTIAIACEAAGAIAFTAENIMGTSLTYKGNSDIEKAAVLICTLGAIALLFATSIALVYRFNNLFTRLSAITSNILNSRKSITIHELIGYLKLMAGVCFTLGFSISSITSIVKHDNSATAENIMFLIGAGFFTIACVGDLLTPQPQGNNPPAEQPV